MPKYPRKVTASILVVVGFLLVGCSSSNTQEAKKLIETNWSMDTTARQSFAPSYREEATIPIIRCGDSHYVHVKEHLSWGDRIYELTDLTLSVKSEPVTPADKANGIEWRGEAVAKCKLTRPFFCDDPQDLAKCRPFTWADCAPITPPSYGLVKKSDGTWIMTPGISDYSCESHPVCLPLSCTDIASLPK